MGKRKKSKSSLRIEFQNEPQMSSLEQWPSKPKTVQIPPGSNTMKIIISNGEIIERVYQTPNGQIISLFPNLVFDKAA